MKIKTGDKVKVIAGKEKGKEGKVIQIFSDDNRVVIEGINLATRHLRSRQRGQAGQKIKFPAPLHVSNVQLISGKTSKSGRVGYKFLENNDQKKKVRIIRRKGKSEDVE